ncbi:MAG: hypothetical protein ACHQUC_01270 [Chlamydiales bacterium]
MMEMIDKNQQINIETSITDQALRAEINRRDAHIESLKLDLQKVTTREQVYFQGMNAQAGAKDQLLTQVIMYRASLDRYKKAFKEARAQRDAYINMTAINHIDSKVFIDEHVKVCEKALNVIMEGKWQD